MKASSLLGYAYNRIEKNVISVHMMSGLNELAIIFDLNDVESKEIWFEIHPTGEIDFIIQISDFSNMIKLCEYMTMRESFNKEKAWITIKLMLEKIAQSKLLKRYMHVLSLEFDMNIIVNKSFSPCIFLEFDVEKMEQECIDDESVYKEFERLIYRDIYDENSKILTACKEISNCGVQIWNVGFMYTREPVFRIFYTPISPVKVYEIQDKLKGKEKYRCTLPFDSMELEGTEIMLDCDYYEGSYCSFGMSYYIKDGKDKMAAVNKWINDNKISENVTKTICNWRKKEIIQENNARKLLMWQIAHFKIKSNINRSEPKLYIRVLEES